MPRKPHKDGQWKPFGEDALYIYKECHNYPDFSAFIKKHTDWEAKYERRNLRINYNKCVKRLRDFQNGECKFNFSIIIIFVRHD